MSSVPGEVDVVLKYSSAETLCQLHNPNVSGCLTCLDRPYQIDLLH